MKLTTKKDRQEIEAADYARFEKLASEVLFEKFGLESLTHHEDIAASVSARVPTLTGEITVMLLAEQETEARTYLASVLQAAKAADAQLFAPCPTREEFARILAKNLPVSQARGEAARSGPEESRRAAYQVLTDLAEQGSPGRAPFEVPLPHSPVIGSWIDDPRGAEVLARWDLRGRR